MCNPIKDVMETIVSGIKEKQLKASLLWNEGRLQMELLNIHRQNMVETFLLPMPTVS